MYNSWCHKTIEDKQWHYATSLIEVYGCASPDPPLWRGHRKRCQFGCKVESVYNGYVYNGHSLITDEHESTYEHKSAYRSFPYNGKSFITDFFMGYFDSLYTDFTVYMVNFHSHKYCRM